MEGKVCSKCKQWKPLEEYHKKKTSKDGRVSQCKECKNKTSRRTRVVIKEGMKKCTQCGVWKPLEEYYKDKTKKDGRQTKCKECVKEQRRQHYQNNKEQILEQHKQHYQNNKEQILEQHKQHYQNNKEYYKEQHKQHYQNNKEYYKEQGRQHYQNNKEHRKEQMKQYRQDNAEYIKEQKKQYRENNKQNNLQYISSIVEQINPVFKQLNLPVYGYVYMFENIKTGHKYLGQSINPLKERYSFRGGIIKSWIKERLNKNYQKFTEELIEEDIVVTEVLDVAFCQYHLDKLEAYYINKYDSFLNGYNNQEGNHNTNDGIEEFNQILLENNLEFIDGKLVKIA